MKILFKQPENDRYRSATALEEFGILQCFFKRIVSKRDKINVTRKRHYHQCVEVHIITKGYQIYEIGDKCIKLEKGSFLMISPLSYHRVIEEANETEKYSFTFELKNNSMAEQLFTKMGSSFSCETPIAVRECIACIEEEKREHKPYHTVLICNRVLECILQMLRLFPSAVAEKTVEQLGDMRLELAKQYLRDNICYAISVDELADYCRIGKKQLTRIFLCGEGCTAAEYVRRARCRHIEKLLADPSRTLSGVSEEMHFCNEYYFNTYFKRYSGMTPGAYRRSILGTQCRNRYFLCEIILFYRFLRVAFFNEAHLRCMKNEAGLCPMKRAFGTCGRGGALRFMFAKQTHHTSVASASYRRSRCFIKNIRVVILTSKSKPCLMTRLFSFPYTRQVTPA